MLPRRYLSPSGHWRLGPHVTNNSQGIACGRMIFVAGQVDLDEAGRICHSGDLDVQTRVVMDHVGRILAEAGAQKSDLVKLTIFYVNDGSVDEDDLLRLIAGQLGSIVGPGPVVTTVPLPGLAHPGMMIEIEGIAMRDPDGRRLPRAAVWSPDSPLLPSPFSQAVRCGEMILTGGVSARDQATMRAGDIVGQSEIVLRRLDCLLGELGADLNDVVKTNMFTVDEPAKAARGNSALIRAGFYREPGPAATSLCLSSLWPAGVMIKNDAIAMRGCDGNRLPRIHLWPGSHWNRTQHLPYCHGLRCGDFVFLGGQVSLDSSAAVLAPGDMVAQTRIAMDYVGRLLGEASLDYSHVVKVNSFYGGGVGVNVLRPNLETRFSYFPAQGPTSTGVPVPRLRDDGILTEIDAIAMV